MAAVDSSSMSNLIQLLYAQDNRISNMEIIFQNKLNELTNTHLKNTNCLNCSLKDNTSNQYITTNQNIINQHLLTVIQHFAAELQLHTHTLNLEIENSLEFK